MTDKNYTLIAFIADRSGSMGDPADGDTTKAARSTSGIHDMVREQRKLPGKTEFQMTYFDYNGGVCLDKIAPGNGDEILKWTCRPRGGTPLQDAMATTIVEIGERLAAMPESERPGRVMIVTATDGLENQSQEYRGISGRERLASMIKDQAEKYGWDFIYIGTGFDDFDKAAASVNIGAASTMSSSPVAMAATYGSTNVAMTRARTTGAAFAYSAEDRQAVKDAEDAAKTAEWKSTGRADRSKS